MKKNIVIIQNTTLAENYGLSTYLRNIVNKLALNKELDLSIIISKGKLNKDNCPKNVNMYEIPGSTYSLKHNAKFTIEAFKILKQINSKQKIDTIHCLYPNSSVAAVVLFKLLINKKVNLLYDLRSPWIEVGIERGSINKNLASIFKFFAYNIEYFLSYFVNKYIFITEGLFKHYRNKLFLNKKPHQIIPSGIDTKFFKRKSIKNMRKKYGIKDDDLVVGYVGVISKMRDLNEVLRAFAEIKDKRKNLKFMFIGDGDALEGLKKLTRDLKIEDRVVFTGRVPYDDIADYTLNFDAGICHLRDTFVFRQSYPMKILEYLAAGLPVYANNIQAHIEIAKVFNQVKIYPDTSALKRLLFETKKTNKKVPNDIISYDWKQLTYEISKQY